MPPSSTIPRIDPKDAKKAAEQAKLVKEAIEMILAPIKQVQDGIAAFVGKVENATAQAVLLKTALSSGVYQEVATRFLCPELWTREQYESAVAAAGLRVRVADDLSPRVLRTWEICSQRAKAAGVAVKLLPAAVREFVAGIDVIIEAYRSGEMTYTVITAQKP